MEASSDFFLVEAEQQLLGAILVDAGRMDVLGAKLRGDLFLDPVHRRIYERCRRRHEAGHVVSITAMASEMRDDEGLTQLGGPRYLSRLAGSTIASAAAHYADLLEDQRLRREAAEAIEGARAGLNDPDQSVADVVSRLEAQMSLSDQGAGRGIVSAVSAMSSSVERLISVQRGDDTGRVHTGLPALDAILVGMGPGDVHVIGGRPSMGKSALALEIAAHVAENGGGVCIVSLEMLPEDMMDRLIARRTASYGAGVSYSDMARPGLSQADMGAVGAAARDMEAMPIHFLPPSFRDISAVFAGVRQVARRLGPDTPLRLVVVDYLQLMTATGVSRYEQVTAISQGLKGLAMQLRVPVLALSQLSRQVETRDDKRPMLSDLRESGQIEQDADSVMFCYRGEYYLERDPEMRPERGASAEDLADYEAEMARLRNRMEIAVAKQRKGAVGVAHVRFNPALNVFWEDRQ